MWLKVDSRLINLDHVASINVIDCAPKDRDLKTLYIQQGNMHENLVSGKAKDIDSLRNCIARAILREDVNLLDVDKLIALTTTPDKPEEEPDPDAFNGQFRGAILLLDKLFDCIHDDDWEGEDDE